MSESARETPYEVRIAPVGELVIMIDTGNELTRNELKDMLASAVAGSG